MNLSTVWEIFTKLLDICLVWLAFYYILKNVKNNIKMVLIVKGVFIILLIKVLSDILNLYTVGVILEYAIQWGPLAIIVIFQPEIRSVLESLGRTQLLGRHKILTVDEREISLEEYIKNATKVYADISDSLLETIFFPNSPLHDGGVIIQGDRITCAGAVFRTSMNPNVSKRLGTRHRAALGIAEESDAIALVVSEETGRLSIAVDSNLHYNLDPDQFRMMLIDELKPKMEVFFEADDESEGDEE